MRFCSSARNAKPMPAASTGIFAASRTLVEWADPLGTTTPHLVLPAANPQIYALRVRASLFGFNAPHPLTLSNDTRTNYGFKAGEGRDWTFSFNGQVIDLDTTYPGILGESWLVLSCTDYQELYRGSNVIEASLAKYTLAGKTTRISLDTNENLNLFQTSYRDTMVFAQSEPFEMAEQPITTPITGATIPLAQASSGLVKGQWLVASGKDNVTGDAITEIVQILEIDGATITVTPPLLNSYARASFSLNANVAHATHGETVSEILGSGDASQSYQQFTLRQPPLTYVSAANVSGATSTLEVRINDILWHETQTLYGRS